MYIYLIVNHVTGRYYVGQHKGGNLRQYFQQKCWEAEHELSPRSRLYAAIRENGRDNFTIHALLSDVQTRLELNQHEREFITFLRAQDRSTDTTSDAVGKDSRGTIPWTPENG